MTYGKEGILGEDPQEIMIKTAYRHDCEGSEMFFKTLQIADISWALTLYKANFFQDGFMELLDALVKLESFPIEPQYGDIYNSKTVALNRLTPYGKNIHFSRPRREAINVAFYIKLKDVLVSFMEESVSFSKTLINLAKQESSTIMPDFTYLQHAQPTTFGHYILTFLPPIMRDLDRMEQLYKDLNKSVAGSGAVNGCSIDIDRDYLSKLLDCDGVELHTRDSMWRSDIVVEAINRIASIMTNLNRFADELQIFISAEFDMIQLSPSLSRSSVIMPNKQNPYGITYFRGLTNEMIGKVVSYLSYEKVISGNPDSRTFVYVDLIENFQKATDGLKLFATILKNMHINRKTLQQRVKNSFFYATDIAEALVKEYSLSYQDAHDEVGRVIRYMRENGIQPTDIKKEYFRYNLNLDSLIDPYKSIQRKRTIGGVGDLDNIIEKSLKRLYRFKFQKSDFSFLEKELKRFDYDVKFTI